MADAETVAGVWLAMAKPLSVAVMMLWIAAAAEVSGPLLISYFIDNMVARHHLPLGKVAGLAAAYGATISGGGSALRPVFII